MNKYVEEIQKYPLLTVEQEQELAERIAEGDETAREQLTCSNLRLVVKIANSFKGMGVPIRDLVGAGNVGLMNAVSRFKPNYRAENGKIVKFSTFAAYHIKHDMKELLSQMSSVSSMTIGTRDRRKKILDKQKELGEGCTAEQVAKEIGMKRSKHVRAVMSVGNGTRVSLDKCIDEDGRIKFMDMLKDDSEKSVFDSLAFEERLDLVMRNLVKLDEKSLFIIKNRFGMNDERRELTLKEISDMLNLTKERIRQLENEAIAFLRAEIEKNE